MPFVVQCICGEGRGNRRKGGSKKKNIEEGYKL